MKILYYRQENQLRPGILAEQGVIDISKLINITGSRPLGTVPLTIEDVREIKNAQESAAGNSDCFVNAENLAFGPCIPNPGKIICIGLNYRNHALESGMAIPKVPVVFTKYNNTLTDFGNDISLGTEGEQFDYEVELGVIIGKHGKNIPRAAALDYVLGYCVANDLSCRDLQFMTSQWLIGKSLDHFLPLGKYFVTADEIGDPQNLRLQCMLNGEVRQLSNTSDMIFSVAEIIEFLSKFMTLEPGDLILTGTPEGVIMGMEDKKWLKRGDVVTVEIEKLGGTTNRMV